MQCLWMFLVFIQSEYTNSAVAKFECGYKQCPQTRDGALNVHVIAHSHMDAGWVKTFDEYYHGTRTSVSTANVQLIYHSILSELLHDKRRKFTFSETAYFWRWWKEQRPATRATFRTMVQEGRIEFAGGGWVQNDEATVDYQAIIDLYTWGLRKLNDTLGPCGKPKAAWQIDSYGHTREQTSLLAQMGFDGLFIGRVDHKEREAMIEEDRMEFMWRGNDVLGKMSDIMTHTLFNLYNPPEGFCFDFLCNDEPIMDDPDSKVFNADKRVGEFISRVERQAKYYDHDNILVMMGGDFTYQSAASWFMNIDKLINYINTHPANMSDVNIFYSTPSCYLKALYLYGRRDKAVFMEKGDHVPYGSDAATYWTGYYTSRPTLKYFIKKGQAFLQVVKQLTVIVGVGDTYELHLLRHAVSLLLHHDAITGTCQQHVANDFTRILNEAIEANTKKISGLLSILTPSWGGSRRSKNHQQFVVCHQLNISQCRISETQESFLLLLYNPSSLKTYHYVRLPAVALNYAIKDLNDDYVEYQLVPLHPAFINLPGRRSSAIQEVFFEAENIPPLGYSAFYITAVHDMQKEKELVKKPLAIEDMETNSVIANEYLKVTIDQSMGLLESVQHVDGVKIQVTQNFLSYSSTQTSMHSGAYSFRPTKDALPVAEKVTPHILRGPLVKEVRQRFADWLTQIIRLYRGEEFVEFEWLVGPVPVGPDLGKEVVTRFTTNITNSGQFFTDSNGRQMMKRSCWNESASHLEKKSRPACYFPVTSRICIHSINTSVEMCVLTDRAQGGSSYNEGELELMIHRRLLTDDGFGLEEPLNEQAHGLGLVVAGRHRLYLGNYRQDQEEQGFGERVAAAARRWRLEPWGFLTGGDKISRRKWANVRNKRFSALRPHALPRHVEILTLEPWKVGSVLLRLENTQDSSKNLADFGPGRSQHTTIDLRKVFMTLQIRRVRETTLAANQWLDEARQMDWSTRYVYSGGSDGIAPEDNIDHGDDPRPLKDGDQFFDEDKKLDVGEKVRRTKDAGDYYNSEKYRRRKRSSNSSDDIQDNVISRTSDTYISKGDSRLGVNESHIQIPRSILSETQSFSNQSLNKHSLETRTRYEAPLFPLKNQGHLQRKRSKSADYIYLSDEIASSEEDFSRNLKRNNEQRFSWNRKSKSGSASMKGVYAPSFDDDITKSIYEMYYKSNSYYGPPQTTNSGSSEEYVDTITRPIAGKLKRPALRRQKPACKTDPKNRRQRTSNKGGVATERIGTKARKKISSEESEEELEWSKEASQRSRHRQRNTDHDLEDYTGVGPPNPIVTDTRVDDEEVFVRRKRQDGDEELKIRRKRSGDKRDAEMSRSRLNARRHRSSGAEEPYQEFLVTLRPTQIRTFVVWFEKKAPV